MNKIIYLCFTASSILLYQCSAWRKPLTLDREEYHGSEIRLDGMYFNKKIYTIFLYRNGLVLGSDGYFRSLESAISIWNARSHDVKMLNNSAPGWGVFQVDARLITMEIWIGPNEKSARYPTSVLTGLILNDTTMILEGEIFGRDTFRFHHMPIKPDSTNRFIK